MKARAKKTFNYRARMVKAGNVFDVKDKDFDNLLKNDLIEKEHTKKVKTKEEKTTNKN